LAYVNVSSLVYVHIESLEKDWLAKYQGGVSGFIHGMILRCAVTLKHGLSLDQLQQI